MSILLKRMLSPYMAPVGDADGGGGVADRGDDFTPMDDAGEAAGKADVKAVDEPKADADDADDADDLDPEDPDAVDDKAKPKKDSRIPLSRHKDILAKEREARTAAEAKLAQYEKGQQVAAISEDITKLEDDVLAMEKDYLKHLADGEVDKAAETMTKIRKTERQINEAKSDFKLQASIAQTTEQIRYDDALGRIEEAYPVLNEDSDDFDKEKLLEVVEMKVFYENMRNMTPTKALQAAVRKILGTEGTAQEKVTTVTPKVDAKDVASQRRKAAVAKALDATGKTPASTTKVGMDSNKAGGALNASDVMKMSQEEFKKLPDDVLARMRGDEFV